MTPSSDKWYNNLIKKVKDFPHKYPLFSVEQNKLYKHFQTKHNININNSAWKIVVPKQDRKNIFERFHDNPLAAHFGFKKCYDKIFETYWWPGMRTDLKKYIAHCKICNEQKVSQLPRAGLMGSPKNINNPFRLLSIDIQGPFPKSKAGHCYLLVVVDWFTKFTFIHKMKRALSKEICTFLDHIVFSYFGVPQILVVDNGSQFKSKEFVSLSQEYNIKQIWYNAKYHPQANNVERANRVIGTAIRSYIKDKNHRDWDKHIHQICNAINNTIHFSTNFSPAFLTFGRILPTSGDYFGVIENKNMSPYQFDSRENLAKELSKLPDIYEQVSKNISKSYEINKKYYNLRKRHLEFEEGDTVFKRNFILSDAGNYFSKKLAKKFIKCKIFKKISPIIYELLDENGKNMGRYHIKDLKPGLDANTESEDSE